MPLSPAGARHGLDAGAWAEQERHTFASTCRPRSRRFSPGVAVALSIGLVLVVISEFPTAQGSGLGHFILDQQGQFDVPRDVRRHPLPRRCSVTRSNLLFHVWSSGACWHGTTERSVNEVAEVSERGHGRPRYSARVGTGQGATTPNGHAQRWSTSPSTSGPGGAPGSGRPLGLRQDDPASSSVRAHAPERGQRAPRRPARRTGRRPRSRSSSRTTSRSLFPWLTVIRNVMFPLRRAQGCRKPERRSEHRGGTLLEEMGLHGVADKYPWELSDGMQQRVAIARALVSRPEPASCCSTSRSPRSTLSPARSSKTSSCESIAPGWRAARVTIVHVTHDIDEAVYLADRVLVLSPSPWKERWRARSK